MAKHTHRYQRAIFGKNNYVVFRCNLPDCNHYVAKQFAEGKRTICNRCGNEMILDKRAMRFEKPYCVDCVRTKKGKLHDDILAFIEANDASAIKS